MMSVSWLLPPYAVLGGNQCYRVIGTAAAAAAAATTTTTTTTTATTCT